MNGYINSHINEVSMLDLYLNMIYCDFPLQPVDMKRSVSDVLSDYVFRAEDAAAHICLRADHREPCGLTPIPPK